MSNEEVDSDVSLNDCSHYLKHLSALSASGNPVIAIEDVTNQFGVLLVKSGTVLDSIDLEPLQDHRLSKPVDQVLQIQHRESAFSLLRQCNELTASEPDLQAVASKFRSGDHLRHLFHTIELSSMMLQTLTVLKHAFPRVYHRALFTVWLATLIAKEQGRDKTESELSLIAALCHDFGLLHINPELVDKKHDIQPEEWTEIQRHVVYGALVAEKLGPHPQRLPGVVLQHHERRDGAGYPTGRGNALDPLGQIIAMSDMIHAVRFQHLLLRSNSNLQDCRAYLHVNSRTFGEDNYQTIANLFRNSSPDKANERRPLDGMTSVEQMLDVNKCIAAVLDQLAPLRELLDQDPTTRVTQSLLNLSQQVQSVCRSSGVGTEVMEYLLGSNDRAEHDVQDMRDIVITSKEVIWLIRRIYRQLREHVAARDEASPALEQIAEALNSQLEQASRTQSGI